MVAPVTRYMITVATGAAAHMDSPAPNVKEVCVQSIYVFLHDHYSIYVYCTLESPLHDNVAF